jgi:hypothetical protein
MRWKSRRQRGGSGCVCECGAWGHSHCSRFDDAASSTERDGDQCHIYTS